ncbi:MAG TPA: phosphoribosylglycinamide formyltransferase [Desulfobacteraceae bacterium]|nr:phosphoribosylglycinamide formyltransferase [Desulfobacteraceae bacterium]
MSSTIRIGVLISGGGSNLQAIIDACESGRINGKIVFAGADTPDACGLERAGKHNIPTFVVDYKTIIKTCETKQTNHYPLVDIEKIFLKQNFFSKNYDFEKKKKFILTRVAAETALLDKIKPYSFDILVLAGFMRKLTPYFIDKINSARNMPGIMNIHPALLPAFPGVDGYGDTFRYGCKVGGCTVHFVDYGEDSGPIIGQKTFTINKDDTLESIKKKGLKLEWKLYPECIKLFAEGRLKIIKKEIIAKNGEIYHRSIVEIE